MEPTIRYAITDINPDRSCSVLRQTVVEYNGEEVALENHREALVPGQFTRAREILPDDLYAAVEALWTQDMVATYQLKQEQRTQITKTPDQTA